MKLLQEKESIRKKKKNKKTKEKFQERKGAMRSKTYV